MKKIFLLTIILVTGLAASAAAESLTLTTYYPAPFGAYDRMRFVPRPAIGGTACDLGTIFYNSDDDKLTMCAAFDGDGEWVPISGAKGGVWQQDGDDVYLTDHANTEVNVGIGTNNPITLLEIDGTQGNFRFHPGSPSDDWPYIALYGNASEGPYMYMLQNENSGDWDFLGGLYWGSWTKWDAAGIESYARTAHGAGSAGADLWFRTTPEGTTTTLYPMNIEPEGNVVIGTAAPQNGELSVYLDDNSLSGMNQVIKAVNLKTSGQQIGVNGTADGLGAARNIGLYGWAGQATENFGLLVDAGYGIFDDRVGIGTRSPFNKLDISSGGHAGTEASWVTDGSSEGIFIGAGSDHTFWGLKNRGGGTESNEWNTVIYFGDNDIDDLEIISENFGEVMRVTGDGKVGIGITDPQYDLVVGNGGEIVADSDNSAAIQLWPDHSDSYTDFRIEVWSDGLTFQSGDGPTNSFSDRMTIDSSGNVGIGTNNPLDDLHIEDDHPEIRLTENDHSDPDWWLDILDGTFNIRTESHSGVMRFDRVGTTHGVVGINRHASSSYHLDVEGQIRVQSTTYTSDARLKKDVSTLSGALGKVTALRGVRFKWIDPMKGEDFQLGLIAQEIKPIVPEVVVTDEDGIMAVQYANLVPLLIEAVKEQQGIIENLRDENTRINQRLEALEGRM